MLSLGLIAFIMSSNAASGCNYISPTGSEGYCYGRQGLFQKSTVDERNGYCEYSQCIKYPTTMEMIGGSIKPAQAFGAIAAFFGLVIWFGCLFQLFFKFPKWLFKTIGSLYLFCFVSQMLTLMMLNLPSCKGSLKAAMVDLDENFQCNLGSDAIVAIVAAIFYLGLGITVLVCPVPKTAVITCIDFTKCCQDGCNEDCGCCIEDGAVETTSKTQRRMINNGQASPSPSTSSNITVTETTYNEDGTVTVKEETVHADGSKTVSITTKPQAAASVPDESAEESV